ncbi:hypothetical protein ACFVYG_20165 [Streptomyces sp. NPDC058256]|uniref:hypothetical protein n=1 Tax=Streptomyces sp. NPDC058256 TaxID=3346408 RepID=UPI0036EB4987
MPDTATPTASAPNLFATREALDHELTASGTWHGLYTAVHASTPRLAARAHDDIDGQAVAGLAFCGGRRNHQLTTSGSVLITPDTGAIAVRAYTVPEARWFAALDHLGAVRADQNDNPPADCDAAAWTWRSGNRDKPGILLGHLRPATRTQAQTLIERDKTSADSNAMLVLKPDSRAACPAAWLLAVGFFHVLATGAPASPQP